MDILRRRNINPLAPTNGLDIEELILKTRIILIDEYVSNIIMGDYPGIIVLVVRHDNIDKIVERAICLFYGKESYEEVILGLDPGPDYAAYALIVDGVLFESGRKPLNNITDFVVSLVETIPHKRLYIRIGSNLDGIELAEAILTALGNHNSVFIEIVDEHNTSKHSLPISELSREHIRDKDIKAAINISLRNGSRIL